MQGLESLKKSYRFSRCVAIGVYSLIIITTGLIIIEILNGQDFGGSSLALLALLWLCMIVFQQYTKILYNDFLIKKLSENVPSETVDTLKNDLAKQGVCIPAVRDETPKKKQYVISFFIIGVGVVALFLNYKKLIHIDRNHFNLAVALIYVVLGWKSLRSTFGK